MNPIPKQRQYTRRTAFILAEYTLKEGAYRDFIKNISADGLFVRTWRKFVAEESIVLKFPLFNLIRLSFNKNEVSHLLALCHRVCCICHRFCGVDIETDRIVPIEEDGTDEIEKAVLVCFECHAEFYGNNKNPEWL